MLQPHIQLYEDLDVKYAILPGDPARLNRLIPFLDDYEEITFNREYRSITGYYRGVKILGMSTGMGGVSTAIGVEELKNIGVETLIRIGSCGALVPDIAIGDTIISSGCVRDDGTSPSYIRESYPAVPDAELLFACIEAAREMDISHHVGVTRSHESFYAEAEISQQQYWSSQGVLCDDMETAALLVVGRLRGMKCASLLNCVATHKDDGERASDIADYVAGSEENPAVIGEQNEILVALEAIYKIETQNFLRNK